MARRATARRRGGHGRRLVRYLSGAAVVLFVLGPALTPIGPVAAISAAAMPAGAVAARAAPATAAPATAAPAGAAPALVDQQLTVSGPPVRVDAGGFVVGTAPRPARTRNGRR